MERGRKRRRELARSMQKATEREEREGVRE